MKTLFAVFVFCFAAVGTSFAGKPCDELKSEIGAKLDAKNVKGYELNIVRNEDLKDEKVVGSCEGGTKKITYLRHAGGSEAQPPEEGTDHHAAAPAHEQSEHGGKGPADAHKDSPDHPSPNHN